MATSSVPKLVFTPTGIVTPTEADILAGVQADMNAAFGGNLNPALETPQGQMATTQTAVIASKNSEIVNMANMVNPDFSTGRWQDAIGRFYFLDRNPAEPTVVQALCVGEAGTPLLAGIAKAKADDGNIYVCMADGTIPVGGSITLPFACTVNGPIECGIGALNTIYQAIPGWDTITNVAAGVEGNDVESPSEFEARRKQSVALNSVNSVQSIRANVLSVPDVIDAYVVDNDTNSTKIVGGVSIAANSVYVAAIGGLADDVAKAIWNKKSLGCSYTGTTTVTVTDDSYETDAPTYDVKFTIPSALPIFVAVTLADNAMLPANIDELIQQAIISAFAGGDGGSRAKIGSTVFASRYYAPVAATDSSVQILSIFVGTSSSPTANSVAVNIDQIATVDASNITVAIV